MAGLKTVHVLRWGLASAIVMVIGSFGPWAKVFGLVSISGTDGGGDGWIVIGAAAVGAIALFLWRVRSRRWLILAVIAAGAALATTIYDRVDLESSVDGIDIGQLADAGWGIYVAMIGSASLAVAGVVGWMLTSTQVETPGGTPHSAQTPEAGD